MSTSFTNFGKLELETEQHVTGFFIDFLEKNENQTTRLCTLPIDVNGEFVFYEAASGGAIQFAHQDLKRQLTLNKRGTVVQDRL